MLQYFLPKMLQYFFLVFCASVTIVHSASFPKILKKCPKDDPKLNECLTSAFIEAVAVIKDDGLPELKMPPLQPLIVGSMKIGKGSGAVGLDQIYENAKIFNIPYFKTLKVTGSNFKSPDNYFCNFEAQFDNITFTSDFTGNGKIVSIPLQLKGPFIIELKDTLSTFKITFATVEKKGKTYLKINEFGTDMNPKAIHFDLQNNQKNEFKIDINTILNDNSLELFKDVKPAYDQAIGMILKNQCNQFFSKVPLEELFD